MGTWTCAESRVVGADRTEAAISTININVLIFSKAMLLLAQAIGYYGPAPRNLPPVAVERQGRGASGAHRCLLRNLGRQIRPFVATDARGRLIDGSPTKPISEWPDAL